MILINYNAFLAILHAQHASEHKETSVHLARINFIYYSSNVLKPVLMGIIPHKNYVKDAILHVLPVLGILLNNAFLVKETYFCMKINVLKYALRPITQLLMFKNAKSVPLGAISVLVKIHLHVNSVLMAIIYQMGFA